VRAAISFGADAPATRGDRPLSPLRGGSRARRRLWLTPLPALLRSADLPLKGGGGKHRCSAVGATPFLPPPPLRGRAGEGGSPGRRRLWLIPLPTLLRSVDLPLKGEGEEIAA
jgi:hypothetical protein